MAPINTVPSPRPLHPRSPSNQNMQVKSPLGRSLPLRKPSLRNPVVSPQKDGQKATINKQALSTKDDIFSNSPPASKRRRLDSKPLPAGADPQKPGKDYDMSDALNEATCNKYVKGKKLGSGTYADVFKGHYRKDPTKIVALKQFFVKKETKENGIDVNTLREIKYIQELAHTNIVGMFDVFLRKETITAVIEFCGGGELESLIRDHDNISYGLPEIKAWMGMMFRGIYFCHKNFVLHRDIKPGNILIADDGNLKIADFGLARTFAPPHVRMSLRVVTIWYRPPELFFGARHYSGGVDIWSFAMIFAELLLRRPWIAHYPTSENEAEDTQDLAQLAIMNEVLGTPHEDNWPGVSDLKIFRNYVEQTPRISAPRSKTWFQAQFPTLDEAGLDLLRRMTTYDPRERPTARDCLDHEWFSLDPRPTDKSLLPVAKGKKDEAMGMAEAKAPGQLTDPLQGEKFKGVARKLDFGSMK